MTTRPRDDVAASVPLTSRGALHSTRWLAAAVVSVIAICGVRILREPRYFFWDDTQLGAYGQWYALGSRILSGSVTWLAPGSWQGSNYLAEGQWGLWNPLTWAIAVSTHAVDNATLVATAVKVGFLLLLTIGAFLVAREYGADPAWAALAGFTSAFGGQTIYMDSPSWVTGLQNIALFAFAWWGLRRLIFRRCNPGPFLISAYLLITFGYVFGVIELAVLIAAFGGATLVRRDRMGLLRAAAAAAVSGLLAVFVYLPGVLTSPVTTRAGGTIANDQFLNMDLGDLATSPVATAVSSVRGYWGDLVPVPLQYITWLLPLLAVLVVRRREWVRGLIEPLVVLVFTLALVVGPSVVGPLRYPARMMPYAVLAVAVLLAVLATRGWPARPSRARVGAAIGVTAVSAWLGWAAQPDSWAWVVVGSLVQVFLIFFTVWPSALSRRVVSRVGVAGALLAASVVVLLPQIARYPTSPLGNFNVPSSVTAMHAVGDEMADGIFTVGDVYSLRFNPDAYQHALLANLWYVTGKDAASVYTVLPFATYASTLCVDLRGATCPEALDALFADSDAPLADDLALNTIIVVRGEGLESSPTVPPGWRLETFPYSWTLHRVNPIDRAGGVARTTDDVAVSVLDQDSSSVTLRVDAVPNAEGTVVYSRLAWPGYSTDGGTLAAPDRGFLLTLSVNRGDVGSTITVSFRPPGWGVELACGIAACVLGLGWIGLASANRRRKHVEGEPRPIQSTEPLRESGRHEAVEVGPDLGAHP